MKFPPGEKTSAAPRVSEESLNIVVTVFSHNDDGTKSVKVKLEAKSDNDTVTAIIGLLRDRWLADIEDEFLIDVEITDPQHSAADRAPPLKPSVCTAAPETDPHGTAGR